MQTITLKIEDSINDKFLWLLNHLSTDELEILDKTTYQTDNEYLKSIKGMEESIIKASKDSIENDVTDKIGVRVKFILTNPLPSTQTAVPLKILRTSLHTQL